MKTRYIIIPFIAFLTGCSNSDNSQQNINSALLGVWETQACVETPTQINVPSIPTWSKATYEFLQNGDIIFTTEPYTDSSCTVIAFNSLKPITPVANYQDFGETTLEEGIPGYRVNIKVQATDQLISTGGFYTINSNTLCFSFSYDFGPTSFSILLDERPPIDFTTCLVPQNQP